MNKEVNYECPYQTVDELPDIFVYLMDGDKAI